MYLLEHLNDSVRYLEKDKSLLISGDELLFGVPNINAFLEEI